ncbi:MAG: class III extradiol ring-cleavage dioxygenase [Kineosporiaceae bacterium]
MDAYTRFLTEAAPLSTAQRAWTPADGPLPALYLGHGAPPLLEDAVWMGELFAWAQRLPKPRAVLVVSAHWEHAPLSVSSTAAAPGLVYDFAGFDPRYFAMTYPTPEAGELGRTLASLLPDGTDLHEHRSRGLDHGAWVPLKVMYPLADVPVLQLSLPTQDPYALLALGARLRPLREDGVLVVGSGFLTHGLPFLRREHFLGLSTPPGWSSDFDAWAAQALADGDVDTLARFADRSRPAPGMPFAHPTPEHYLPLFLTLGAGTRPDAGVDVAVEGFAFGLSKRSFEVR